MGPPEILLDDTPPTATLGKLEPVRALRRSRGANPATRPSSSLILRLRPRGILFDLGDVLDGRYFGVGIIGDGVVIVPTPVPALDASTSSNASCGVDVIINKIKVRNGSELQVFNLGS